MKIPTTNDANLPAWRKKLEAASGQPLSAPPNAKHDGREFHSISFHCAKTGSEFSAKFSRKSQGERFRIREIRTIKDNPSSPRSEPDNAPVSHTFNANDFDFTGWYCPYCQYNSGPQFVKCNRCQRLICGAQIITNQDGTQTFRCAPDCGGGGPLEGSISSYSATQESAKDHARQITKDARGQGSKASLPKAVGPLLPKLK